MQSRAKDFNNSPCRSVVFISAMASSMISFDNFFEFLSPGHPRMFVFDFSDLNWRACPVPSMLMYIYKVVDYLKCQSNPEPKVLSTLNSFEEGLTSLTRGLRFQCWLLSVRLFLPDVIASGHYRKF